MAEAPALGASDHDAFYDAFLFGDEVAEPGVVKPAPATAPAAANGGGVALPGSVATAANGGHDNDDDDAAVFSQFIETLPTTAAPASVSPVEATATPALPAAATTESEEVNGGADVDVDADADDAAVLAQFMDTLPLPAGDVPASADRTHDVCGGAAASQGPATADAHEAVSGTSAPLAAVVNGSARAVDRCAGGSPRGVDDDIDVDARDQGARASDDGGGGGRRSGDNANADAATAGEIAPAPAPATHEVEDANIEGGDSGGDGTSPSTPLSASPGSIADATGADDVPVEGPAPEPTASPTAAPQACEEGDNHAAATASADITAAVEETVLDADTTARVDLDVEVVADPAPPSAATDPTSAPGTPTAVADGAAVAAAAVAVAGGVDGEADATHRDAPPVAQTAAAAAGVEGPGVPEEGDRPWGGVPVEPEAAEAGPSAAGQVDASGGRAATDAPTTALVDAFAPGITPGTSGAGREQGVLMPPLPPVGVLGEDADADADADADPPRAAPGTSLIPLDDDVILAPDSPENSPRSVRIAPYVTVIPYATGPGSTAEQVAVRATAGTAGGAPSAPPPAAYLVEIEVAEVVAPGAHGAPVVTPALAGAPGGDADGGGATAGCTRELPRALNPADVGGVGGGDVAADAGGGGYVVEDAATAQPYTTAGPSVDPEVSGFPSEGERRDGSPAGLSDALHTPTAGAADARPRAGSLADTAGSGTPMWMRPGYPPARVKSSEVLEVLWGDGLDDDDGAAAAASSSSPRHAGDANGTALLPRCASSGNVPETPTSCISEAKRQHSSVLSMAEAATQHAECAICFDPLCEGQVVVFVNPERRRVCRHYFHEPCVRDIRTDTQGVFRCPLCRCPFAIMMRLPDPRVEPKLWFLLASTNEDTERLAKTEVKDVLFATVNTDSELLEKVVDNKWSQWDPENTGAIDWVHAEGLLEFVRMNAPGRRSKPPPDLRADRGSWFEFFDARGNGILTEGQVARGVMKTYAGSSAAGAVTGSSSSAPPAASAATNPNVDSEAVVAVSKIIREVFEVFATRSDDMLSSILRGEGWGPASISKEDFVKADGLADAIIAALEHEGVTATATREYLQEDERLAAQLHMSINDRVMERERDVVRALPWACAACTYINPFAAKTCEMCGQPVPENPTPQLPGTTEEVDVCAAAPLPPSPSDSPVARPSEAPQGEEEEAAATAGTNDDAPAGDVWNCALCTFENPTTADACAMCETPRAGVGAGAGGAGGGADQRVQLRRTRRAQAAAAAAAAAPGAAAARPQGARAVGNNVTRGYVAPPEHAQAAPGAPFVRTASGSAAYPGPFGGSSGGGSRPRLGGAHSMPQRSGATAYLVPAAAVLAYPSELRWEPDVSTPSCRLCRTNFGFFTRRHHCRGCGRLCCSTCAPVRPSFRTADKEERLCDRCFTAVTNALNRQAQTAAAPQGAAAAAAAAPPAAAPSQPQPA